MDQFDMKPIAELFEGTLKQLNELRLKNHNTSILERMTKVQFKLDDISYYIRSDETRLDYWMPHFKGLKRNFDNLKNQLT